MGGEGKHPIDGDVPLRGFPVRDPDKMTDTERDKLYELFKKRFVGMNETQIDQTLRFDDRANDFMSFHERDEVLKVRHIFKAGLDAIEVADKIDDFIAYYEALANERGVVLREVSWSALRCKTRAELKRFYLKHDLFVPLMHSFKLTPLELKRIGKRCLEKGAGPQSGYFSLALEVAIRTKDKKLLSRLLDVTINDGHYESALKVAEARKQPLTRAQLETVALVILGSKIGTGHTHWYERIFIDHPELGLGPTVVDTLLKIFWGRKELKDRDFNRDWWMLNDILRYAEVFKRPLTINEKRLVRDRLWLEHHEDNKKKALEIAYELGMIDKADGRRLLEMKQEQFYEHLRRSEFEKAASLAKELGIEMTSRELYGQKHGQMASGDKDRLRVELVKKLVEEVGKPSEPVPASQTEGQTLH